MARPGGTAGPTGPWLVRPGRCTSISMQHEQQLQAGLAPPPRSRKFCAGIARLAARCPAARCRTWPRLLAPCHATTLRRRALDVAAAVSRPELHSRAPSLRLLALPCARACRRCCAHRERGVRVRHRHSCMSAACGGEREKGRGGSMHAAACCPQPFKLARLPKERRGSACCCPLVVVLQQKEGRAHIRAPAASARLYSTGHRAIQAAIVPFFQPSNPSCNIPNINNLYIYCVQCI